VPGDAPWISVVIPAYDEERGIAAAVEQARSWLEARGSAYEVLVVDNASADRTVERLEPLLDEPRIRLLANDRNRGKGFSMRRGMLAASAPLRLHCDADCTGSLRSLERMLGLLEDADVVVGSRLAEGADVGRRQPLHRRVVGRTFVELCRRTLREPTHDLYCGFKLWRAEAAEAAYSRGVLDGWVFDAEVLAIARALGYRVRETGIAWADREGSRLSMPRVLVPAVRDLVTARGTARRARREAAAGAARAAAPPAAAAGEGTEPLVAEPLDRGP
jgi:dolichyl-phosphate beta-glucosyltransferase